MSSEESNEETRRKTFALAGTEFLKNLDVLIEEDKTSQVRCQRKQRVISSLVSSHPKPAGWCAKLGLCIRSVTVNHGDFKNILLWFETCYEVLWCVILVYAWNAIARG